MLESHKFIIKLALVTVFLITIPMLIDLVNIVITGPRIDYMLRFASNRGIQYVNQETFRGGGVGGTNDFGNFYNYYSDGHQTDYEFDGDEDWEDLLGNDNPATLLGKIFEPRTAPAAFNYGSGKLGDDTYQVNDYEEINAARYWAWMYGPNASQSHQRQLTKLRTDIAQMGNNKLRWDIEAWLQGPGVDQYFGYQMLTPNNLGIAFVPIEAATNAARWQLANLLAGGDLERLFMRDGDIFIIWQGWEINISSLVLSEAETEMINIASQAGKDRLIALIGAGRVPESELNSPGSGWTRIIFFDFRVDMRYVGISGFRIFARAVQETAPNSDLNAITNTSDDNPEIQRYLTVAREHVPEISYDSSTRVSANSRGFDQNSWNANNHWGAVDEVIDDPWEAGNDYENTAGIKRSWFSLSRVNSGRLMYYHLH